MLSSLFSFISRHRRKFLFLALTGVLGAAAYYYVKKLFRDSLAQITEQRAKLKLKQRKEQELIRLKSECKTTVTAFLPPLRRELNRLTDPRPVTVQLKELRALQKSRGTHGSKEEEAFMERLWEELKIISLARLVASVYSLTLMDLLLRVQLHVAQRVDLEDGPELVNQKVREQFMFKATDFFVAKGLDTLLKRVMGGIRKATRSWSMGTDATVSRAEIIDMVNAIRKEIEEDSSNGLSRNTHAWFLSCLIQPDAALAKAREDANLDEAHAKSLKKMLDETMDLLESPHFAVVLEEALSKLFQVLLDDLHARQFEGVRKPGPPAASPPEEKFILAKVIVGMKLVAGEILATGEPDDETGTAPAVEEKATTGEPNKYVRELEAMKALDELGSTILGIVSGDDVAADDEVKALTGLLGALGGEGGAEGQADIQKMLQQMLGGGDDLGALLKQQQQQQQQPAGPRITMVE